jgi:hypothetical protein
MKKVFEKIKEEFVAMLPPTIFFLITLQLVTVIRVLMLKGTGVAVGSPFQVVIAALILGKAVLIADLMPFINLYPHKPLIYNVVWKTAIYLVIATLIHYTERLFEFWKAADSFAAATEKMLAEVVWPHFWAVQILLLVLIFFYNTIRELVRVIGRDKMLAIFFLGPPRTVQT